MARRRRQKDSSRWDRTPPTQTRGRETLERILRATEDLLGKKPFHLITLGEIVRRARTNTGSFYARFSSKEAVLPLLYERHMARVETRQIRKIERIQANQIDFREAVEAIISLLHDGYRGKRWLLRAYATFSISNPTAVTPEIRRLERQFLARLVGVLLTHSKRIRRPNPQLAARLAVLTADSVMREKFLHGEIPRVRGAAVSQKVLKVETAVLVEAYLAKRPNVSRRKRPRPLRRGQTGKGAKKKAGRGRPA